MTDNSNDQHIDLMQDATESLLYGDPEVAAGKLRAAIHHEAAKLNAHQAGTARLHAEQAKSQAALKRFREDNPEFMANEAAVAAGEKFCYGEQVKDLQRIGLYDAEKFRKDHGRDPTLGEMGNYHLFAHANGYDVRPVEEILNTSADRVSEEMPHVRRRERSEEHNRKRAIQDRLKASAKAHGTDLEGYGIEYQPINRQPNLDSGEPATERSVQDWTAKQFGEGVSDDAEASRMTNRRNAIARMQ